MDYAVDVPEWGKSWKGILFRRTFSQFREIIDRSKDLFYTQFPGSEYKEGTLKWVFPNGASLQFFHMAEDSDAEKHLGLQYPWIGFDELPHWPSQGPYNRLKATNRSPVRGIPKRIRSTGNPGGPGLGWIKSYFQIPDDPAHPGGDIIRIREKDPVTNKTLTRTRMFLRSTLRENRIMLDADPTYVLNIMEACDGNEQLLDAWLNGNFNVFFGKFFTTFDPTVHCVDPKELFQDGTAPDNWRVWGSLDYGENDYTSFGLWITGLHPELGDQEVAYRVGEWYGRGLWLSEYAGRIADLVDNHPVTAGRRPERVFADTSIFYTRAEAGGNPMDRMVSDVFRRASRLRIEMANKNRIAGWRYMKELLSWKRGLDGGIVKFPRMFYSPDCIHFERQMENAVYAGTDDNPKEDIDTRTEEHSCDDARYFAMGAMYPRKFESEKRSPFRTMGDLKDSVIGKKRGVRESFFVPGNEVDLDLLIEEIEDG